LLSDIVEFRTRSLFIKTK